MHVVDPLQDIHLLLQQQKISARLPDQYPFGRFYPQKRSGT
jgi:hypothetical protein